MFLGVVTAGLLGFLATNDEGFRTNLIVLSGWEGQMVPRRWTKL